MNVGVAKERLVKHACELALYLRYTTSRYGARDDIDEHCGAPVAPFGT